MKLVRVIREGCGLFLCSCGKSFEACPREWSFKSKCPACGLFDSRPSMHFDEVNRVANGYQCSHCRKISDTPSAGLICGGGDMGYTRCPEIIEGQRCTGRILRRPEIRHPAESRPSLDESPIGFMLKPATEFGDGVPTWRLFTLMIIMSTIICMLAAVIVVYLFRHFLR